MGKLLKYNKIILNEIRILDIVSYKVNNQQRSLNILNKLKQIKRFIKKYLLKDILKFYQNKNLFIYFFNKNEKLIIELSKLIMNYLKLKYFIPINTIILTSISRIFYILKRIKCFLEDIDFNTDNINSKNNNEKNIVNKAINETQIKETAKEMDNMLSLFTS